MESASSSDEFYDKLKSQLYETSSWPSEYLYKFIVKSDIEKTEKIKTIFDNMGAVIQTKASKTAKYTSLSINVLMTSPDHVVDKYKEVIENVEGVISL